MFLDCCSDGGQGRSCGQGQPGCCGPSGDLPPVSHFAKVWLPGMCTRDVRLGKCSTRLGWTYLKAFNQKKMSKKGSVILYKRLLANISMRWPLSTGNIDRQICRAESKDNACIARQH
ncbi:TPA: hypothetical protein ACH3X3_009917 [Trebouxia sp. C0006]